MNFLCFALENLWRPTHTIYKWNPNIRWTSAFKMAKSLIGFFSKYCKYWCTLDRDDPPQPLSGTLDDQLPSMSGAHGLKDFLCSVHLLESFEGRIYSLEHFHKCKFVPQRTQEDEHYRENPSNHELLTLRGVDRRVCLTRVGGAIPLYSTGILLVWENFWIQNLISQI